MLFLLKRTSLTENCPTSACVNSETLMANYGLVKWKKKNSNFRYSSTVKSVVSALEGV